MLAESSTVANISAAIVAGCAVVGAGVAVFGLSVWRRQLRGTSDFETAKSVLRGVYGYADALRNVRNPFMFGSEFPERSENESHEDYERRKMRTAYGQRWIRANEAAAALGGPILEAKVLWGREFDANLNELKQLRNELLAAVENYLMDREGEIKPTAEERKATRQMVFGSWSKDDQFEQRLVKSLEIVEKSLLPYLER